MAKKFLAGVLSFLFALSITSPVLASTVLENPEPEQLPPLRITEVYPNAPGSAEAGKEFIEIHNTTSEEILLDGYSLIRKDSGARYELSKLDPPKLPAGEYLTVLPSFALLNGGGTIVLEYPPNDLGERPSFEVVYPSFSSDDTHSWSLIGEVWQKELPTPGAANPEPPLPEEPIEEEEPQNGEPPTQETLPDENPPATEEPETPCNTTTLFINEILANPKGDDKLGGEYVELYNGGTEPILLTGCLLKTDKTANHSLGDTIIEPGRYHTVYLSDKLLNNGGHVTLVTYFEEAVVEYPALGDDETWALIDSKWEITKAPTPGYANQATPITAPAPKVEARTELEPCPPGKVRNPETNRCRNVVLAATTLLPCGPGETRNPNTNRCRKVSSATSALTPCRAGYERNPETNRCRQIKTAFPAGALAPCQPGYERNPETNRCRKSATSRVSGIASFPVSSPSPLHPSILLSFALLTFAYGLYEYRLDAANLYHKLRGKLSKN